MILLSSNPGDLIYELSKSFIIIADEALLSKEIDVNTYTELTQLKYSFINDYEMEADEISNNVY